LLDGDDVRAAVVPAHDYSEEGREGFYATLINFATMLSAQGFVVLVPATAHRAEYRTRARSRAPAFIEVFVDTPTWECERRDPKRLYAKSSEGIVKSLPGAAVPFEEPKNAEVVAHGGQDGAAIAKVVELVGRRVA